MPSHYGTETFTDTQGRSFTGIKGNYDPVAAQERMRLRREIGRGRTVSSRGGEQPRRTGPDVSLGRGPSPEEQLAAAMEGLQASSHGLTPAAAGTGDVFLPGGGFMPFLTDPLAQTVAEGETAQIPTPGGLEEALQGLLSGYLFGDGAVQQRMQALQNAYAQLQSLMQQLQAMQFAPAMSGISRTGF